MGVEIIPDFKKGNEFIHAQYYTTGADIPAGVIQTLVLSSGMARRKIYFGTLPYQSDVSDVSAFPKTTGAATYTPVWTALGTAQWQLNIRLTLRNSIILELPCSSAPSTYKNGYAVDGSGFGATLYGNILTNTGKDTIKVTKTMSVNGYNYIHALMINPFEVIADIDKIELISLQRSAIGVSVFFYLACLSDVAT